MPVREGSEEYLDSEKYEVEEAAPRRRAAPLVATLNATRRAHPALQRLETVDFLETRNDELIAYSKSDGADTRHRRLQPEPDPAHGRALVEVPAALGLGPSFRVRDLLDGRDVQLDDGRQLRPPRPDRARRPRLRLERA